MTAVQLVEICCLGPITTVGRAHGYVAPDLRAGLHGLLALDEKFSANAFGAVTEIGSTLALLNDFSQRDGHMHGRGKSKAALLVLCLHVADWRFLSLSLLLRP